MTSLDHPYVQRKATKTAGGRLTATAALFGSEPQRTIGLITQQGADQFLGEVETLPDGKGDSR